MGLNGYSCALIRFSDKIAEKFAKKTNFSYESITPTLSKKELKLSLDRACLKYLKKSVDTENDTTKKRSIDISNESVENGDQPPKKKKKVTTEILITKCILNK